MGFRFPEDRVRSNINVTPLVDVCLVLLIIFMVVTPMVGNSGHVSVPATTQPEVINEGRDQLTLTIDAAGLVFVGENWVAQERLTTTLAQIRAQSSGKQIRLRGDRNLNYAAVRDVMRSVSEAGFDRADLITLRKTGRA